MKYIEIDFLISFSSCETRQVIVIKGPFQHTRTHVSNAHCVHQVAI